MHVAVVSDLMTSFGDFFDHIFMGLCNESWDIEASLDGVSVQHIEDAWSGH